MSKYHKILGVRPDASIEEIKKAYRVKAFHLHPDRNKAADAHERFIEVTMAYEMLKSGKLSEEASNGKGNKQQHKYTQHAPIDKEEFKTWYQQARQRADEQAKERYYEFRRNNEAFKKKKYYTVAKIFTLFVIFISIVFTLALVSIPLWIFIYGKDLKMTIISVCYTVPGIWAYKYTLELIEGFRIHFGR